MIRIVYMSDLHLELEDRGLPIPRLPGFKPRPQPEAQHPARGPKLDDLGKVDLVVMAGDIHGGLRGIAYADQVAKYLNVPVAYVAGNHEFYSQHMEQLLPEAYSAATQTNGRVYFLENNVVRCNFGGVRVNVLGCTLWTDYRLNGDANAAMREAARRLNDHVHIRFKGARFTPEIALARHQHSRKWLHKTLARLQKADPGAQNIIVTHHSPSAMVLGMRSGAIGPAYGSDLLIEFAHQPLAAWIHGHTHHRHESTEHGIRLVSAPRGYREEGGGPVVMFRPGILELNA